MAGAGSQPLVGRTAGAVLFRREGGAVDTGDFLRWAQALARIVPEDAAHPGGPVVNLCRDRACFTAAFAAALLRNRPSLLPSDRSPEALRRLAADYPGAVSVTDDPALPSLLPHCLLPPAPMAGECADNPVLPADRLAAIVFTSGSTGLPVAHRKSWGALAARSVAAGQVFGFTEDDPASVVGTVPPQHMYGFETTALLPLHAPCSSLCGEPFYPADIADALARAPRPRILVTTPLHLRALLQAGITLPALHAVISATAPLEADLAAQAEARWHTAVREIYGATEAGSVATRRTVQTEDWQLYPGLALRLDDDRASIHAPGAAPQPLADHVALQGAGRFRLLGRQADLVKLGGRRASLAGLNRILAEIEGVQDAAFLAPEAVDGPLGRMTAFVVAPGQTAEAVLGRLRGRIDPVFLPRRLVMLQSLPRDAVGKLPRAALLALARDAS